MPEYLKVTTGNTVVPDDQAFSGNGITGLKEPPVAKSGSGSGSGTVVFVAPIIAPMIVPFEAGAPVFVTVTRKFQFFPSDERLGCDNLMIGIFAGAVWKKPMELYLKLAEWGRYAPTLK
jgi:hypothetical protein